jgi:nicotinate phosphoribosyltransferase
VPIIKSLLDADFYKFTMAQVIRKHHSGVKVRFAFKNRSSKTDLLAAVVDVGRLREELQIARGLRLLNREIDYLRNCPGYQPGLFSEEYLGWLSELRLPPIEVGIKDGEISIETEGDWEQVTFWETLALNVVNELYYDGLRARDGTQQAIENAAEHSLCNGFWNDGRYALRGKIAHIKRMPSARIIEFGNRRHHSVWWHEQVLEELVTRVPGQLLGTSNVRLAKKFGIQPIGTFAHEMFMCYAAIAHSHGGNIVKTHGQVLTDWRAMYGNQLSVALTDTFGSGFFFRDMSKEAALAWTWLRHDSGDPFAFGERAIAFYEAYGIDPMDKGIVYSDGLTVDVIQNLMRQFDGRIDLAFGWGTDLTNDLGYRPLSLVMKAVEARGYGTVKLSDNPAKATGRPDKIGLYKDLFLYEEGERVECKY